MDKCRHLVIIIIILRCPQGIRWTILQFPCVLPYRNTTSTGVSFSYSRRRPLPAKETCNNIILKHFLGPRVPLLKKNRPIVGLINNSASLLHLRLPFSLPLPPPASRLFLLFVSISRVFARIPQPPSCTHAHSTYAHTKGMRTVVHDDIRLVSRPFTSFSPSQISEHNTVAGQQFQRPAAERDCLI